MGATLGPAELNYIQIPLVTDNWNWDVALQWNSLENQRRINQSNVWWTLSLDIRHFFASSAGMEHSLTNRSFSLSLHYNKSISNKYQANWISIPILMINPIPPLFTFSFPAQWQRLERRWEQQQPQPQPPVLQAREGVVEGAAPQQSFRKRRRRKRVQ